MEDINQNIPELIRQDKFRHLITSIKNYEDTIEKLFNAQSKSTLISNPYINLWNLSDNKDLFPDMKDVKLDENGISFTNIENDIVITGSYIRTHLVKIKKDIKNEVYLYKINDVKWKDLIDIVSFESTDDEYIYNSDSKIIILEKKKYRSPAHVLLQGKYNTRIGLINNKLFCSSMFLIDYFSNRLNNDLCDPVFNFPYDPLEIYKVPKKNKLSIQKTIELVDTDKIIKINKENYDNFYGNKTIIELCIDKYITENHSILQNYLVQGITHLSNYSYKRPPFLYAKLVKLDEIDKKLYDLLINIDNAYGIHDKKINFNNLDDVNLFILEHCISIDNVDYLLDFMKYIKYEVNKTIIDLIIKYNSINVLRYFIVNKMLDQYYTYYSILKTQEINLFKIIEPKFDIEVGINFLKEIITCNLIRSLYFLYIIDHDIINTKFENNNNILHLLKYSDNSNKLISLIMSIKPELINEINDDKQTPVIYHSINNPNVLNLLLNYEFDTSICDNDGNTFLHHLCKIDNTELLKKSVDKYKEIINVTNKKYETPIIISCKCGLENNFYVLKYTNANLDIKDIYGNTVYHYICLNSICLGINIPPIKNNFGFVPTDYCKIAEKYYN